MILIGYKFMAYDGNVIISMANKRIEYPLKKGTILNMPYPGIFLSTNKQYVLDYYGGHNDQEALLSLLFDTRNILTGNLTDREPEVTVSKATILDWEEFINEDD